MIDVRSFVGMTSDYRRCIPHFAYKSSLIIVLPRKYAKFKWDETSQNAFDIKNQLANLPKFGFSDTFRPYILYCDASGSSIGASLLQPCEED